MADSAGKTQLGPDHNPPRMRKFLSSFLFKVVMAVLFVVLVPVMTSHPPEFIVGQAAPARGWEILNILLVGIAVSYGLFSKRNVVGSDAESGGKSENAQSYVNRFLQLSSLFDDESDGGGGGNCGSDDVGRIQFQSMAWNSQYFRNEPMLVVDEDRNVGDSSSRISDKPLLLPVRSLHSRVSDDPRGDSGESRVLPASLSRSGSMRSRPCDSGVSAASFSRSSSNPGSISIRVPNGGSNMWDDPVESGSNPGSISRRVPNGGSDTWGNQVKFGSNPESISKRVRNGGSSWSRNDGRVSDTGYLESSDTDVKDSVVLPSPIPWQLRSGRMMDSREGVDSANTFEINDLGGSWPQVSRSSSSPKRLSPTSASSSVSPEGNIVTDSVKKKSSSHRSRIPVPPPPPPPPPPAATFRLPAEKPQSVPPVNGNDSSFEYRGHPKSVRTIRASAETACNNANLEENLFDVALEKEEQRQKFLKKMIIDSEDEETENDDDDSDDDVVADEDHLGVPRENEEFVSVVSHSVGDGGPDVDKKADEFIAKFREQIRLQRIASIKRSSAEISKSSAR